ncbi:hypothetical protein B0G84_8267 [Paraburkholderia sp. BL8N3]|nr:hypothetical protein [Paraburkholderia sp. BL8N3]TCK32464.1 hypothetical protein B0G84_8267 [Paraburkholderia sp. BL8N3]
MFKSVWASVAMVVAFLPLTAHADACYQTSLVSPSPFLGNNDEIFKLGDGSVWEVKYEYSYLYAYHPQVTICPGRGKLIIGKKSLNVQRLAEGQYESTATPRAGRDNGKWIVFEETAVRGLISGVVQQGSIFRTVSGSIYEVVAPTAQAVALVQPPVIVLKSGATFKLEIEGFSEALICRKLN